MTDNTMSEEQVTDAGRSSTWQPLPDVPPLDHWRNARGTLQCPAVGLAVELIDSECSACGEPAEIAPASTPTEETP